MSGEPTPPQNVRAVDRDGREVPVELVYAGRDHRGLHVWEAVVELGFPLAGLRAAVLPARTTLVIGWREDVAHPDR